MFCFRLELVITSGTPIGQHIHASEILSQILILNYDTKNLLYSLEQMAVFSIL